MDHFTSNQLHGASVQLRIASQTFLVSHFPLVVFLMTVIFAPPSLQHYPLGLGYLRQCTTATRIFATQRLMFSGLDGDDVVGGCLLVLPLYGGHSDHSHGSVLLRLQVIAYDRFVYVAGGRRARHGHAGLGELYRSIGEKVRRIQAYIVAQSVVRR